MMVSPELKFTSRLTKENLLKQFRDVFEDALGNLEGPVQLEVDHNIRPVKMPVRKFPVAVKEDLKHELERMEELKVIEKVTTQTDWVSSLVVEQKIWQNASLHRS